MYSFRRLMEGGFTKLAMGLLAGMATMLCGFVMPQSADGATRCFVGRHPWVHSAPDASPGTNLGYAFPGDQVSGPIVNKGAGDFINYAPGKYVYAGPPSSVPCTEQAQASPAQEPVSRAPTTPPPETVSTEPELPRTSASWSGPSPAERVVASTTQAQIRVPSAITVTDNLREALREIELGYARKAQAFLPYVRFCQKYRASFGWDRCWADADQAEFYIAQLESTSSRARVRKDAVNYLRNLGASDALSATHSRLDAIIDQDVKGLPDDFWNSQELNRLKGRAESLADSNDVNQLELFVQDAHPSLKAAATRLRKQHPRYARMAARYTPLLAECRLTKAQKRQQKQAGGTTVITPVNQAVCEYPPLATFRKKVTGWESRLPIAGKQFNTLLEATMPQAAYKLSLASSRKKSIQTLKAYLAKRGMGRYLHRAVNYTRALDKAEDPNKVSPPCQQKRKQARNRCLEAMNLARAYGIVHKPASIASNQAMKACGKPKGFEALRNCIVSSSKIWEAKANEQLAKFREPESSDPDSKLGLPEIKFNKRYLGLALLPVIGYFYYRGRRRREI